VRHCLSVPYAAPSSLTAPCCLPRTLDYTSPLNSEPYTLHPLILSRPPLLSPSCLSFCTRLSSPNSSALTPSGPSGPSINGVYEPTDEICGGWPVYRKKDDAEKWLEYIVATNEWYVKPTADKGKAEGWMCIASDPPTRPELSKGEKSDNLGAYVCYCCATPLLCLCDSPALFYDQWVDEIFLSKQVLVTYGTASDGPPRTQ
jgi:hypothetical protein